MSVNADRTIFSTLIDFIRAAAQDDDFPASVVTSAIGDACGELSTRLNAGTPAPYAVVLSKVGDLTVFRVVLAERIDTARTARVSWFMSEREQTGDGEWAHLASNPYCLSSARFVDDHEIDGDLLLDPSIESAISASVPIPPPLARQLVIAINQLELCAAADIFADAPESQATIEGLQVAAQRLVTIRGTLQAAIGGSRRSSPTASSEPT
jgi:hypothetical protein